MSFDVYKNDIYKSSIKFMTVERGVGDIHW